MIKVMQFGEGNFLRAFVDFYFENLNRDGGDYSISIVKPIAMGDLSLDAALPVGEYRPLTESELAMLA